MPIVQVFKITRPCGCATPVVAIYTGKEPDSIKLAAHRYPVNQYCRGVHKGHTTIRRWLTVVDYIKTYVKPRDRRKVRQELQNRCIELKEEHPRIPETFLP